MKTDKSSELKEKLIKIAIKNILPDMGFPKYKEQDKIK